LYSQALVEQTETQADGQDALVARDCIIIASVYFLVIFKSVLLSLVSTLLILTSIGVSTLITRSIFNMDYLPTLNHINFIYSIMIASDFIIVLIHLQKKANLIEELKNRANLRTAYFFRRARW